jgi:hypothetical protein
LSLRVSGSGQTGRVSTDDKRPADDDPKDEPTHDVDPGGAETAKEPPVAPAPRREGVNPHEGFRVPLDVQRSIDRAFESVRYSRPALDALTGLQRYTEQFGQQIARVFTPQLDAMLAEVRKSVSTLILSSPQWQQTMAGLRALGESMLRYWPDNWEDVGASDIARRCASRRTKGCPWCGCRGQSW